ncbi:MAG: IS110 family transposase [Bacteroides intestinalis]|nr:IS110 family transposase [Bacteroides intestinalis]
MKQRVECLGVDVSKYTLDVAIFNGNMDWNSSHIRITNDVKGYKELLNWLKGRGVSKDQLRFCMEYTGLYSQNFRLWLESQKIVYYMVNPLKMHRYEVPTNIKGLGRIKTDKMDAYRIAIYCLQNYQLMEPAKLPSQTYFKLKRLIAERKQYVKQGSLYKQQLHDISAFDTAEAKERKKDALKSLKESIRQTDMEIDSILKEDKAIYDNYNLITSVIGIGRVNAITTIILTENFTSITDPRRYACYIAVAPFKKESGISVQGKTKVSKMGFKQAKADLSIAVASALQGDPNLRMYWDRKKAEGKASGIILNAIKFKLILRIFAVIKRRKPFVKMDAYKFSCKE